jgi:arabinan endo-1,5-alpha-L-arabinosidase
MFCIRRTAGVCLFFVSFLGMSSCAAPTFGRLSYAPDASSSLAAYSLTGDTLPVLDPSVIHKGSTYYAFTTDVAGIPTGSYLRILCSPDRKNWSGCGSVFPSGIPGWLQEKVPGIVGLWAPDVSYFDGEYHVYYAGSTLGSQRSVIGLVTNTTLDSSDPAYQWVDRGEVLESKPGDDFNAIDPNIFVDAQANVWLSYGSYWTGIKQIQLDSSSGLPSQTNTSRYDLATRPGVPHDPIEGASLVQHGNYYYLFVSVDYCCEASLSEDDYKQAVGRSTSPHGPFVDEDGTPMMEGGGTVLLETEGNWIAPGGGTAYNDQQSGDSFLIFHAHNLQKSGTPYEWIKSLNWVNDWPVIGE